MPDSVLVVVVVVVVVGVVVVFSRWWCHWWCCRCCGVVVFVESDAFFCREYFLMTFSVLRWLLVDVVVILGGLWLFF